jgi:hypothetical protein
MPLLDHFHPPLSVRRHWESLYATWTVYLADALGSLFPEGYFVEVQTHAGAAVEQGWTPPALTMPTVLPQGFEVQVFSTKSGPNLVAAIELVSPGNKDRPDHRRAFAAKCASYLYQGISLIVVDVVTERQANLHNEAMRVMEAAERYYLPAESSLYAVAYRPVRRGQREETDLWPVSFKVGDQLPVLPLVLSPEFAVPVDLEATYADACRRRRLI